MFLSLFILFLCLSLVLIIIGLVKPEHSEMALAGFAFMFVLSMTIILGGQIQYKIGENLSYTCLCCDNSEQQARYGTNVVLCDGENSTIVVTSKVDVYEDWTSSGFFGHTVGYWLAVISAIGFIGVIAGLRGNIKQ